MVPDLARMAVIIKADQKTAIITGNYELSYICGLFLKQAKAEIPKVDSAIRLREETLALLKDYHTEDERELNLLRMLKLYKPDDVYDDQVSELFRMGLEEKNIWRK